jgi:hypothetical protein
MHVSPLVLAIAATALWAVDAVAADLSVAFVHPENYRDAAYSRRMGSERDRAEVMRDVEQHLVGLAERRLPPGEALRIEVLDIDLAGWFEPFVPRTGTDLRILRDVTWPRMTVHYRLTRGDEVLADGDERIADMNYLMVSNRYSVSDRLRYEKAMLDDWFDRRIVRRLPPPAP